MRVRRFEYFTSGEYTQLYILILSYLSSFESEKLPKYSVINLNMNMKTHRCTLMYSD